MCRCLITGVALLGFLTVSSAVNAQGDVAPQPLPLKKKLVDQVAGESVAQLLDNLVATYDDLANAEIAAMLPKPGYYHYGPAVVPNLARVRRLLQDTGAADQKKLRPKLEKMLQDAVKDYDRFYDEYNKENFENTKNPEKASIDPPKQKEYSQRTVNANVATYLLAEFRCFESLPVLAKVFTRADKRSPVSRLFVFYAMHTLAVEHPRDGLTKQTAAALDDYMVATRKPIPAPVEVSLPAWNAALDEGDFRVKILGQEHLLDKAPQVRLRLYPAAFRELEDAASILAKNHGIAPDVYSWFGKLETFIAGVYPAAAPK